MIKNSEVSFYVDTLIVETLLSKGLNKTAQDNEIISDLTGKVKTYFKNQIDPNDPAGSLINKITPGAIFALLRFGWIGMLIGLAMNVFRVDVNGILTSIIGKLKPEIAGNKQIASDKIDEIVNSSVQEFNKPMSEGFFGSESSLKVLQDAKMIKLALMEGNFSKTAKSPLGSRHAKTMGLLVKIFSWVFKIGLASVGLMVAGDVVNKFLGRPNALDNTIQGGKPVNAPVPAPIPLVVSKRTKFPVNKNYTDKKQNLGNSNWVESVVNDEVSITGMLINFTKEVYSGLDGKEAVIRNTPGFQVIKDRIVIYNRSSAGDAMVFIPKFLTSKKQIVDLFIDDVAENTP